MDLHSDWPTILKRPDQTDLHSDLPTTQLSLAKQTYNVIGQPPKKGWQNSPTLLLANHPKGPGKTKQIGYLEHCGKAASILQQAYNLRSADVLNNSEPLSQATL